MAIADMSNIKRVKRSSNPLSNSLPQVPSVVELRSIMTADSAIAARQSMERHQQIGWGEGYCGAKLQCWVAAVARARARV